MNDHVYAPVVIALEMPVNLDGGELRELKMRPPKAVDVINAKDLAPSENHEDATLFANLCNVPVSVIHDLAYFDYMQLKVAYDRFFYTTRQHCEMQSLPLRDVVMDLTLLNSLDSTQPK